MEQRFIKCSLEDGKDFMMKYSEEPSKKTLESTGMYSKTRLLKIRF